MTFSNGAIIEPGILPVCDALNSIKGITTLYSCEGHPWRPARPYVSFRCDEDKARKVNESVKTGRELTYVWWVTGNFTPDGEWIYCLEPNDIRVKRPLRFGILPAWNRQMMNDDLSKIANKIRSIRT